MKKTATVLILIGITLLVLHYFGKDADFIKQYRFLNTWDATLGWYIRGAIATLGFCIWMFARTAE